MTNVAGSLSRGETIGGEGVRSVKDVARLRLITGYTLILVALISLFGGDWDIQWHGVIGRDRTFTPPHDLILLGIGLSGIVALISILIETRWVRRQDELLPYSSDFLGVLHSALGSYLIGFGAVCSAVAFPLDTYWHSLYGVDVSLWAPFHTMIYMGGVLSTFGIIYLLLSAAHLSETQSERGTAFFSYAGVVTLLGILLSKFSTFLVPALSGHALHLSSLTLNLFPLLMALTAIFVCILAVRIVPWTGAATLVVMVFLLLWLLIGAFVPPMMTLLVQAEHQSYLARASQIGSNIIPLLGQTPALLLASLSIDGVVWLGRRGKWKLTTRKIWVLVASMVSMFIVAGFTLVVIGLSLRAAQGGGTGGAVAPALVLSLILTVPGCLIGGGLGWGISDSLQALRR